MKQNSKIGALCGFSCLLATSSAFAVDRVVATTPQFANALAAASPGDSIILQPGTYGGGHFRAGLQGVTIRSSDPANPAIISGGSNGIQLSDASDVTIADLEFRNQTGNGLNIDDGGSFSTPTTNVTLRNITVRDIVTTGNFDGIKLSGVNDFLIDGVRVHNWGTGGSAIDMVGCHHGLIQNSLLVHTNSSSGGTTIQPKGGTKDITIRANRIELPRGAGRAVQAGGSTGAQFFRFIDGDSDYEADEITAEGNVVIGGTSAFSWVNIDGGIFHHNLVHRPGNWTMRILNENQGNSIVDTQNGQFQDNIVIFNDTPTEYSLAVNVGPETLPNTFSFARNKWYNLANPTAAGSTPNLPTPEVEGQYGVDPGVSIDAPVIWEFAWGRWVVNATKDAGQVNLANFEAYQRATPAGDAKFKPLEANPLSGQWQFQPLSEGTLDLPAFAQIILIDPVACPGCLPLSGDYTRDGQINAADYNLWKAVFGSQSQLSADGNRDGLVNAADYVFWRDRTSSGIGAAVKVPEPSNGIFMLVLAGRFTLSMHMRISDLVRYFAIMPEPRRVRRVQSLETFPSGATDWRIL